MQTPLTIKFEFDDPSVKKADLEYDGTSLVLVPMVGDWVKPDNFSSVPREVKRRTFEMNGQSTMIILRCQ